MYVSTYLEGFLISTDFVKDCPIKQEKVIGSPFCK